MVYSLPDESKSSTLKHAAGFVLLHQNNYTWGQV